jgi:hypothetical protein
MKGLLGQSIGVSVSDWKDSPMICLDMRVVKQQCTNKAWLFVCSVTPSGQAHFGVEGPSTDEWHFLSVATATAA